MRTPSVGGASAARQRSIRPQVPQELKDAQAAQAAAHPKPVRMGDRTFPLGDTWKEFMRPGDASSLAAELESSYDAGNAKIAPENAHLHILSYCYNSHKPMEAWVQDPPSDGKLKLKMVITPSWHAGSTDDQMEQNGERFALNNVYNLEIRYPDGKREVKKFKVNGKTPEYSSTSETFEIDLKKYAGQDVRIRGWADGSAGPAGYIEARETVLHCPK